MDRRSISYEVSEIVPLYNNTAVYMRTTYPPVLNTAYVRMCLYLVPLYVYLVWVGRMNRMGCSGEKASKQHREAKQI